MKAYLDHRIKGKRVMILGLGAEGRSSYHMLRKLYPDQVFTLADRRNDLAQDAELKYPNNIIQCGANYLEKLRTYDLVIKSPGISLQQFQEKVDEEKLTSQTALFLEVFRNQTIGITGTKGKSTTASLTHHLLAAAGKDALLIGNIGVPPFDVMDRIKEDTVIVFELSSHQLEGVRVSPHIAVLLNIYQEHLDHYADYDAYQLAKYNIARWQKTGDYFIYHFNDPNIRALLSKIPVASKHLPFAVNNQNGVHTYTAYGSVFSKTRAAVEKICDLKDYQHLRGDHNLLNLLAALSACRAAGLKSEHICSSVETFQGLPHRMEFIGEYGGIRFYNDSIATIPEAVIYALETITDVETLLLGGYDRGIDYSSLGQYLGQTGVRNLFFTGNAGKRLMQELKKEFPGRYNYQWFDDFDMMVAGAIAATPPGRSCLLSPAAASYDRFMNFEHRGRRFRELVIQGFSNP